MKKNKRHHRIPIFLPIITIIGIGIITILSSFYEKTWSYNWNEISVQIRDSVKIAAHGGISSGVVGVAAVKPKQFDRRHWIMQNATESELLKLTNYPNATIKTIAYEGLLRKINYTNKTDIVLKSIADTEYPMVYQTGCHGTRMSIAEYLVEFVLYIDDKSPPAPDGIRNRFGFSEADINVIMIEYRKNPSSWK